MMINNFVTIGQITYGYVKLVIQVYTCDYKVLFILVAYL